MMSILQSSRNGKRVSNNNILNTTLHMLMPLLNQLMLRHRRHPSMDYAFAYSNNWLLMELVQRSCMISVLYSNSLL